MTGATWPSTRCPSAKCSTRHGSFWQHIMYKAQIHETKSNRNRGYQIVVGCAVHSDAAASGNRFRNQNPPHGVDAQAVASARRPRNESQWRRHSHSASGTTSTIPTQRRFSTSLMISCGVGDSQPAEPRTEGVARTPSLEHELLSMCGKRTRPSTTAIPNDTPSARAKEFLCPRVQSKNKSRGTGLWRRKACELSYCTT